MKHFLIPLLWASILSLLPGQDERFPEAETKGANLGKAALHSSQPEIALDDLKQYVATLTSAPFEGRLTGAKGEAMATAYFAQFLEELGIAPAGKDGTYYDPFQFRVGKIYQGKNSLTLVTTDEGKRNFTPGPDYHALSISAAKVVELTDIVFAGFGIDAKGYNSFQDLEIEGKWLLLLRGAPQGRSDLRPYQSLFRKAEEAKKKGASGILFIKASHPNTAAELIPPDISVGPAKEILPAFTISDELAASLLQSREEGETDLTALFATYHGEEEVRGFPLPLQAEASIGLGTKYLPGRNVLGRLVVGDRPSEQTIIIGGHIDHLGFGERGGSLAKGEAATQLHPGADDNASGIAVLMELAHHFSDLQRSGRLSLERDLLFAAWSGEELGLWGSRHFVQKRRKENDKVIYPAISSYLNLDMVGRAKGKLILQGTDSSYDWRSILHDLPSTTDLQIKQIPNPNQPGDSQPFFLSGVPTLSAFSGTHDDYHTPRDTLETLDFKGLAEVTHLMRSLLMTLANRAEPPSYAPVLKNRPEPPKAKLGLRISPEGDSDGKGVLIAEVIPGSPAATAEMAEGDRLVELNGSSITSLEALLTMIARLEPQKKYPFTVERGTQSISSTILLPEEPPSDAAKKG